MALVDLWAFVACVVTAVRTDSLLEEREFELAVRFCDCGLV